MNRRIALLFATFLCLVTLILVYLAQDDASVPPLNRVAAWMPSSWDASRARSSWEAKGALIHEISPVWYQLDESGTGRINPYSGAGDPTLLAQAHAQHALVIPLINNYYTEVGFDASPVSAVIHDPARRTAHVETLVNEVVSQGYDGIDIDYESLNGPADRDPFSRFVEELAAALHAQGKLLCVTVHPKTRAPGPWAGPQAQDWVRIGAAADRVRVMTYAYHGRAGDPGPIAPLWWMDEVMGFATSVISPNKVYVGIHFYGHDWGGETVTSLTWESAQTLRQSHEITSQWERKARWRRPVAEPWFTYVDSGGAPHEVWYANGRSVRARLTLVGKHGLGGIAIWRLGGEDPGNWSAIADMLSQGGL